MGLEDKNGEESKAKALTYCVLQENLQAHTNQDKTTDKFSLRFIAGAKHISKVNSHC